MSRRNLVPICLMLASPAYGQAIDSTSLAPVAADFWGYGSYGPCSGGVQTSTAICVTSGGEPTDTCSGSPPPSLRRSCATVAAPPPPPPVLPPPPPPPPPTPIVTPPPVDAVCGMSINTCLAGNLDSGSEFTGGDDPNADAFCALQDSIDGRFCYYIVSQWTCRGQIGGADATCSYTSVYAGGGQGN